ncbi:MAG: BrnA antitoxin family protein [Pseudomonadota bacterium]
MKKYKKAPDQHKPLTDAEWKSMGKIMHGIDELPESARNAAARLRGRPKVLEPKQHINIRLDAHLVEHLRSTGSGWQTRLNDFLNKSVEQGLV